MKNNKIYAVLSSAALIATISAAINVPVSAKSTDVLVQGKDGKQYQYNIEELVDSFVGDKVLYNKFTQQGEAIGYYDDVINKYVNVEEIVNAFVEDSKSFNIDTFTENAKNDQLIKSPEKFYKASEKDGKIDFKEITTKDPAEKLAIEAIEKLETAAKADLTKEENLKSAEALVKPTKEILVKVKNEVKAKELEEKIEKANKTITDARAKFDDIKAKEKAEKEAKEKAEKEAKEKAEKEAKEKAEKEAKEKAEKEAKQKKEIEDAITNANQNDVDTINDQDNVVANYYEEQLKKAEKEKAEKEAKEKAEKEAKQKKEIEDAIANANQNDVDTIKDQDNTVADYYEEQLKKAEKEKAEKEALKNGEKYNVNIEVNNKELKADGHTIMQVVATIEGKDANKFEGMAEFVSKAGLTAAQKEAAFENGKVIFNVRMKNSKVDINDEIKVRIKSNEAIGKILKNSYVGVESNVIKQIYKAPVVDDAKDKDIVTKVKEYSVDKIVSTNMADRVIVYVGKVQKEHLPAVENGIINNIQISSKNPKGKTDLADPIKLVKIIDRTQVDGGYAFTVLTDLPKYNKDFNTYNDEANKNILVDNQYNYYEIKKSTEDVRLTESTAKESNRFMLIDGLKPEVRAVKTTTEDKGYLPVDSLLVVFSEPVSRLTAENPENYVLNGKKLSKDDVKFIRVADVDDKDTSVKYNKAIEQGKERNSVLLSLTPGFARKALINGKNLIQVKSISDWAGMYDLSDNNKITTQDFTFNYIKPKTKPAINIVKESPEQFVLKFEEPLYTDIDANNAYDIVKNENLLEVSLGNTNLKHDTDYKITYVKENDEYILELKKDWTIIFKGKDTYHNKKFKVKTKASYDSYGNKVNPLEKEIVIPEDTISPKIAEYKIQDLKSKDNKSETINTKGAINITMSEPVQLYGNDKNIKVVPDVTPSEEQELGKGVPVPTFEYVKVSNGEKLSAGEKVIGKLTKVETNHDMNFDVEALQELELGDWKLVVRQISDDVGNTMATEEIPFKVVKAPTPPAPPTPGPVEEKDNMVDPYVVWAFADDDKENDDKSVNDYVYVLYSRQMSVDALRSATYNINGKQVGQDADITSQDIVLYNKNNKKDKNVFYGENGDMNEWKGQLVTIKLPSDFIVGGDDIDGDRDGNHDDKKNVLTVPNKLEAIDDGVKATTDTLSFKNNGGNNQFELSFESKDIKNLPEFEKNKMYKNIESFRKYLAEKPAIDAAKNTAIKAEAKVKDEEAKVKDANDKVKEAEEAQAKVDPKDAKAKAKADKAVEDAKKAKTKAENDLKDAKDAKTKADKAVKDATAKALPMTVVEAGSVKGATAGNKEITGLTADTEYNVTVDGKTTKKTADKGGKITGLDNGKTYKVEEVKAAPTKVDTKSIDTAVNAAKVAMKDIEVSVDGSDVKTTSSWVTADVKKALDDAIKTAQDAKGTAKSDAEAKAAAGVLDTAVATYKSAIKAGTKAGSSVTKVDTKSIDTAVNAAKVAMKDIEVSVDGSDVKTTSSWVTADVKKALDDAIKTAQDAKGTAKSDAEAKAAAGVLDTAVATYTKEKKDGTKTA